MTLAFFVAGGLAIAGCSSTPAPIATSAVSATATTVPSAMATTAPEPAGPTDLLIYGPDDGAISEIPWTVVTGMVLPDAVVSVNGVSTGVDESGRFSALIDLDDGANVLETIASEPLGGNSVDTRIVFFAPPSEGLPFNVFAPVDGATTADVSISVAGGTAPDAIVTVDGITVNVDERGLFTADVALEPGANLIEVVGSEQLGDAGRFVLITVFLTS